MLTDRIDLDDQLYGVFSSSLLLPGEPVRIGSREQLRAELSSRATGGILFTTLQKFGLTKEEREAKSAHSLLSNRLNIIVVVDEAHRGHYDTLDGFALRLREALPKATFLAFTGTPLSEADRDTRKVFGDYIDVYDLTRAVEDGATVRVYHESRLIPLELPPGVDPEAIDTRADEITAGLDEAEQERLRASKTPNLAIEALRRAIEQTMRQATRHNLVRQRSFSDRLVELMNAYRNQHLTAA